MTSTLRTVSDWEFEQYVQAEVDGVATPEELAVLHRDPVGWRAALASLRRETEEHLERARSIRGEERAQVVADLESEVDRIASAWARHNGQPPPPSAATRTRRPRDERVEEEPRHHVVRARDACSSRCRGNPAAWSRGPRAAANRSTATSSPGCSPRPAPRAPDGPVTNAVALPGGSRADALSIPVGEVLGWLVAAGAGQIGGEIGPSVRWLGRVAIWAVELTAHGAMVPLLRQRKRSSGSARESNGSYSVRWTPALVDPARLAPAGRDDARVVLARSIRRSTRAR